MTESPGAIRAAEIITERKYDQTGKDQKRFNTEYGTKTVMGIAAIIDRHTVAPDLLAALEALLKEVEAAGNANAGDYGWPTVVPQAGAAIAAAGAV